MFAYSTEINRHTDYLDMFLHCTALKADEWYPALKADEWYPIQSHHSQRSKGRDGWLTIEWL